MESRLAHTGNPLARSWGTPPFFGPAPVKLGVYNSQTQVLSSATSTFCIILFLVTILWQVIEAFVAWNIGSSTPAQATPPQQPFSHVFNAPCFLPSSRRIRQHVIRNNMAATKASDDILTRLVLHLLHLITDIAHAASHLVQCAPSLA